MMNILESSNLGGYKEVINEIEHQRALLMDLHDLVLPILDPHSGQAKLVQLFEEVFSCSGKIVFSLELGDNSEKQAILIEHKRKGGKNHTLEDSHKGRGNKRRKNAKHISSVLTQAPYFDRYQWTKYGQKWIYKAKQSRKNNTPSPDTPKKQWNRQLEGFLKINRVRDFIWETRSGAVGVCDKRQWRCDQLWLWQCWRLFM